MYKCKNKKSKTYKAFNRLLPKIFQLQQLILRAVLLFLRRFFVKSRRWRRQQQAGFVMPTVSMVLLVVVLLTLAIMLRSFDRSQNASNVRVNQVVLNAAAPAVDRAKAKIGRLLQQFSGSTPNDNQLYTALGATSYTFGDENQLEVVYDINNNNVIEKQPGTSYVLDNDETITTAWRFPVDTDNNGKFDSYTLYGIYLRSPTRDNTTGNFNRVRNPLEARTPPMGQNSLGGQCAQGTAAAANGSGNIIWFKSGATLTKSFYVYTANVPIINPPTGNPNFEAYTGSKGFSALEYEQDPALIPLTNNAVLFQDDLELTPGSAFRLNGRVFTNANLLIGGHGGAITLYQVSSPNSCFYKEENSIITVGGNVGTGNAADTTDQTAVSVDLFQGVGNAPGSATIDGNNRSTTSPGGSQVAYNDAAYSQRIALMRQTALSFHPG
ncbi:MAG: hormogonium polysaccharide biosynthesis protein HpsA [Chroococcidiopsidaceae cyanobacterium CP_BM_RX_35]|nr:hormogonium polysaccharide biosynthesis protein HpsA [Chroococcidiopsidaceae cyanobacterium CP_BM_RX_35]